MSAFNPVLNSAKTLTHTFTTTPARLDTDAAATFAWLDGQGYDVASFDVVRDAKAGMRGDLLLVVIVAASRV